MDKFYDPPRDSEGATVYAPKGQQAITAEFIPSKKPCKPSDPKTPASFSQMLHPGQILWSYAQGEAPVLDPEAAVAVRGPLGDTTKFPTRPTNSREATEQIVVRGLAVRATDNINRRASAVVRGTGSVVVHDEVALGDPLHAVWPRITDADSFRRFLDQEDLTGDAKPQAYPLLVSSRSRTTLIPPSVPTLHVVSEKTLVDQGFFVSETSVLEALVSEDVCPAGTTADLTEAPQDNPPVLRPIVGNWPRNQTMTAARGFARALYELCVDMYRAGGGGANPHAGVRARFEQIRTNPHGKDRIKKIIKKASHALYGARRRTFIGRARRSAGMGDTCDVDIDCLATTNDAIYE